MKQRISTVSVIGAGAIGGTVAAHLAREGLDVELACKHGETARLAADPGIHVSGVGDNFQIRVNAVKDIHGLSPYSDVVLLATKATDCLAAAQDVLPLLRNDTAVVSLQNGICEEAIAEIVGRDRVIGCVVGWGATMRGPAELEVTSKGEFLIGNIDHQPDQRLPLLKELLDVVVPTRISDNIMGELYSKLIVNSCINSLGVITGQPLGELLANSKIRSLFIGLMREAMSVAGAMGIRVEPGGGGKLDYYRFLSSNSLLSRLKQHVVIRLVGFKYRRIRSSSLQSLEHGRRTEIDYLNGYICDRGRERGVPTRLHQAVVKMVKQIEDRTRPVTPDNLSDPLLFL
jgi:2-dehydropantoate 2-reductase